MISDELEPARWLAQARAQSLRLAEARARQPRAWRNATRSSARFRLKWAMAGALTLWLLASGAWALMSRRVAPPLPPPVTVPLPPPVTVPLSPLAAPPARVPATAKAPAKRRKAKRAPPLTLEEGDGELILVAPHEPPPPLFSPEEWKQRGGTLQQ